MKLALDTNRYIDLAKGDEEVLEIVERAAKVYIPFVVVAELRAGFAVGTRGRENEASLRRFLAMEGVEILFASDSTTQIYANLYRQLRAQGTPIPINDLWIAALVQEKNVLLFTRNAHFDKLPQLPRV